MRCRRGESLLPGLVLASLLGAGCGSSAGPCGDAEADDGVDGDAPPCPAPVAESCPGDAPHSPDPVPVLLRASDLDPGTRFVDVSFVLMSVVVLAEREEAGSRFVEVLGREIAVPDTVFSIRARLDLPPGSTIAAVAAAGSPPDVAETDLADYVALLCDGAACALHGAGLDPSAVTELSPIPGGEVPAAGPMRGLWWGVGPAACAYGDGVHCFDGVEWTTVVAAGEAPPFNDMQTCEGFTVAVGEMGRTAFSAWPSWIDGFGEIYPDLLTVACDGDRYLVAGEGGIVMDESHIACDVSDEDIAFIDAGDCNYHDLILGVTSSGRVFIGRKPLSYDSGFCYTGQTLGPLVAAMAEACGIIYNYYFLTADTLYGTTGCAIE